MLIGTIVPNNYFMPFEAVKCWFGLPYSVVYAQGPDLDFNRNMIWKQAVRFQETKSSHLLMIDSDIVFKREDVEAIKKHLDDGLDVVTGIYSVGQSPYNPCIFKRIKGDYKLTPVKEGLNEIGACGGGFLAINKHVIMSMPKDPFDNIREGDIFHGEDISFCHRLHNQGYKLWSDSSIKLGHVRTQVIN